MRNNFHTQRKLLIFIGKMSDSYGQMSPMFDLKRETVISNMPDQLMILEKGRKTE